jgi:uncharacterized protein
MLAHQTAASVDANFNGSHRQVPVMKKPRLNYVELTVKDGAKSKAFYERAFGWSLTEFSPAYHATTTNDVDLGLEADAKAAPRAPLPIVHVDDLEAALTVVTAAGGKITVPIFSFPGGRRFHFLDPSGNELGVWQTAAHD